MSKKEPLFDYGAKKMLEFIRDMEGWCYIDEDGDTVEASKLNLYREEFERRNNP